MLDHLLALERESLDSASAAFTPVEAATAAQILDGKANTDEWLRQMGAEAPTALDPRLERDLATQAFGALTGASPASPEKAKQQVLALRSPESVRHTIAMLTEYDFAFVEKAKEIRSYIVTSLLEESKNPKPEVRLKALKMLGDVTEIGLFTQRIEVGVKDLDDQRIEEEIKRRLDKLTVHAEVVERVEALPNDVTVDDEK
jgi:hypothetical protein